MRLDSDLLKTTAFRWAAVVATAFTALSLTLFAFVYWQTAGYEARELDGIALAEARDHRGCPVRRGRSPPASLARDRRAPCPLRPPASRPTAASSRATSSPCQPGMPADGRPRLVTGLEVTGADDGDGDQRDETMRGLALQLADGSTAVLGLDTDELAHTQPFCCAAFGLGLIPTVGLSLLGGMLLGRRALDHVAAMDGPSPASCAATSPSACPFAERNDEFDRLARSVNLMLDDMERLLDEIRGVGDSIAHDLRTPLTRARIRLERSRQAVRTEAEFRDRHRRGACNGSTRPSASSRRSCGSAKSSMAGAVPVSAMSPWPRCCGKSPIFTSPSQTSAASRSTSRSRAEPGSRATAS